MKTHRSGGYIFVFLLATDLTGIQRGAHVRGTNGYGGSLRELSALR